MRKLVQLVALFAVLIGVALVAARPAAAFPSFSLSPASPSAGALTPGSILNPSLGAPTPAGPQPAPVIAFTNASLGVPAVGNIDDISYGDDQALWTAFGSGPLAIQFSVGVGATGGPWLPPLPVQNVLTQGIVGENAAPGDIFTTPAALVPPPVGPLACGLGVNMQLYDANGTNVAPPVLVPGLGGLVDPPGPAVDDNIDAYEIKGPGAVDYQTFLAPPLSGPDGLPDGAVFFTVDPPTAALMGVSAADVLVTDRNSPTGWMIYAPAGALGLAPGDDIDGLMVADSDVVAPGVGIPPARSYGPQPMDFVAFSLAPGSPSLVPLSPLPAVCAPGIKTPGDIWGVTPSFGGGLPFAMASAESLGLCSVRVPACAGVNDNLDAMDIAWAADVDGDSAPDPLEAGCGAIVGPADTDLDGIPDSIEMALNTFPAGVCGAPVAGMPDFDGDGMPDGWELAYWTASCPGTNPWMPDAGGDIDGDGVINLSEMLQFTSPCNKDTDGDGFNDMPAATHTGPANTSVLVDNCPNVVNPSQANSDGNFIDLSPPFGFDDLTWINSDAMGDACDTDADNDGLSNAAEAVGCGFGPTSPVLRDSDGDGFLDGAECAIGTNPNSAASKPTAAQCVVASGAASIATDTDGDGVKDYVEYCNYNSSNTSPNTDGDACGDKRELASVNADLVVTSADLGIVASAFGVYPVGSYRADMDMNKDGAVTSADLGFTASAFGPCP